jgi:hypothetical protein
MINRLEQVLIHVSDLPTSIALRVAHVDGLYSKCGAMECYTDLRDSQFSR